MELSWFYDKYAIGMCMEFIAAGGSRKLNISPFRGFLVWIQLILKALP